MAISPFGPDRSLTDCGQSVSRGVEGSFIDLQLRTRFLHAPHAGGAVLQQLFETLQAETRRLGFGLRRFHRTSCLDALIALRRCERLERHESSSAADTHPRLHSRHERQRAGDGRVTVTIRPSGTVTSPPSERVAACRVNLHDGSLNAQALHGLLRQFHRCQFGFVPRSLDVRWRFGRRRRTARRTSSPSQEETQSDTTERTVACKAS